MKVSIINNQAIYGIDYSNREDCSEVFEIEDQDFAKIQAGTHTLDLETKELVEVPVFIEPMPEFLEETESEQNIEEDVIEE